MKPNPPRNRGFTLVEVLVGATLAALVMTALLSACIFLARNFSRMANQQALEEQGRRALIHLQADVGLARGVKAGTSPDAGAVTLLLPAGEVTYTYDAAGLNLRRQATFGANRDFTLLTNGSCRCTAFAFAYYTGMNGSPVDQLTFANNVPFSIKQIQVSFSLQTPADQSEQTRVRYQAVSARLQLRNKRFPDGT